MAITLYGAFIYFISLMKPLNPGAPEQKLGKGAENSKGHINIIFTLFNDANKTRNTKFYPHSLFYHVCRYLILKKNEKRALCCPRAAPAEKGQGVSCLRCHRGSSATDYLLAE